MDFKALAYGEFARHEPELLATSRWMYANPELGYEEFKTSEKYVEILATNGFDVEYPAYGLSTAFAARQSQAREPSCNRSTKSASYRLTQTSRRHTHLFSRGQAE